MVLEDLHAIFWSTKMLSVQIMSPRLAAIFTCHWCLVIKSSKFFSRRYVHISFTAVHDKLYLARRYWFRRHAKLLRYILGEHHLTKDVLLPNFWMNILTHPLYISLQEMWWSMTKILWHFNRASQLHTIYDEFEGMDPRPRTLWRFIEFVIIEPTKYDVLLNSS